MATAPKNEIEKNGHFFDQKCGNSDTLLFSCKKLEKVGVATRLQKMDIFLDVFESGYRVATNGYMIIMVSFN